MMGAETIQFAGETERKGERDMEFYLPTRMLPSDPLTPGAC